MKLSVATRSAVRILAIAALLPTIACAEGYPSKPITMYVAYGAGATTDISARALAKAAEGYDRKRYEELGMTDPNVIKTLDWWQLVRRRGKYLEVWNQVKAQ